MLFNSDKLSTELEIIKKDYYELLFNYSTVKSENEELKKQLGNRDNAITGDNNGNTNKIKDDNLFVYENTNTYNKNRIENSTTNTNTTNTNTLNFTNSNNYENNINSNNYKYIRPQTAKTREVDNIFKKSIDNINLFKQNPFFDEEDLMEKYKMDLEESFEKYNIKIDKNCSKNEYIKTGNNNIVESSNKDVLAEDDEDDELNDLINKSISDFKLIKEIKNDIAKEIAKPNSITNIDSNFVDSNNNSISNNEFSGLFSNKNNNKKKNSSNLNSFNTSALNNNSINKNKSNATNIINLNVPKKINFPHKNISNENINNICLEKEDSFNKSGFSNSSNNKEGKPKLPPLKNIDKINSLKNNIK